MKQYFKNNYKEYLSILTIILVTFIFLTSFLQLRSGSLSIPFVYDGGDDVSVFVNAKMLIEQTWCSSSSRLGTPFGVDYSGFSASVMHNFDLLTLKIFGLITGNYVVAANIEFLSTFFLVAIVSYLVMRKLKITHWIAVSTSLVYAFLPYLFIRSLSHIVLTTCYFVPLSFLLCIWLLEKEEFLKFDKSFFKHKNNWLAILFTLLIANNGIAYYPFFTCYMLLITGIAIAFKEQNFKKIVNAIKLIGFICIFIMCNLLPIMISNYLKGNGSIAAYRNIGESETYGLKIVQLFLPINGHGIGLMSKLINRYNGSSPNINFENFTSYIGFMGIIGFIILMLLLLYKREDKKMDRLKLLADLNVFLVLLGTVGGFGMMFSLVISDQLRSYARISIFIGYGCILAFALCINYFYNKSNKKVLIMCVGILFSLFCIKEQFPGDYFVPKYEAIASSFNSDDKLVKQLEASVDKGAMIYQLPFHQYPEAGSCNDMRDYQLFMGYLHSENLKWSYGSIKGTSDDAWNEAVSKMQMQDMVAKLKDSGFSAIYIDRRAYEEKDLKELEDNLNRVTGNTIHISDNENLSYVLLK